MSQPRSRRAIGHCEPALLLAARLDEGHQLGEASADTVRRNAEIFDGEIEAVYESVAWHRVREFLSWIEVGQNDCLALCLVCQQSPAR